MAVLVCQLPAQAGSPGGPVLNDAANWSACCRARRSRPSWSATRSTAEEIRAFLDVALRRPARTTPRASALGSRLLGGSRHRRSARAGSRTEPRNHRRGPGDSRCRPGAIVGALHSIPDVRLGADLSWPMLVASIDRMTQWRNSIAAVEKGPFDRDVLCCAPNSPRPPKDWRRPAATWNASWTWTPPTPRRGSGWPAFTLELGDDAKAAAAIADTLRADPKRLAGVAGRSARQADGWSRSIPMPRPSRPAG